MARTWKDINYSRIKTSISGQLYSLPRRPESKSARKYISICRRANKKRVRQSNHDDIGIKTIKTWFRRTIY